MVQTAKTTPANPPIKPSNRFSAISCRINRHRLAPSARRTPTSRRRPAERASSRLARFIHTIATRNLVFLWEEEPSCDRLYSEDREIIRAHETCPGPLSTAFGAKVDSPWEIAAGDHSRQYLHGLLAVIEVVCVRGRPLGGIRPLIRDDGHHFIGPYRCKWPQEN